MILFLSKFLFVFGHVLFLKQATQLQYYKKLRIVQFIRTSMYVVGSIQSTIQTVPFISSKLLEEDK